MLLIGAGLMIRSFSRLQSVPLGFSPQRLLTMRLSPNFSRYTQPQQRTDLSDRVLRRVTSVSGVESAAFATSFPFNPNGVAVGPQSISLVVEGRPVSKGELTPVVSTATVSPGYFDTIRQPVLQGRAFTEQDDAKTLQAAIINQAMARHYWPGEYPIGRRISLDQGQRWLTIVGVVGDAKVYGLERPVGDEVYLPLLQAGFAGNLLVRSAADPATVSSAVRSALREVDPQLAIDRVRTMESLQSESLASPRVTTILFGLFAALALLISASGIAAVMALSVTQRRNELGIRIALGASPQSVLYMVVRQGLALALAGVAVGIAGSVGLTRLLHTLLYNTSPTDAFTFAAVSLVFLTVAAVACFLPARQVTAIDPSIALSQE
jgi:putative ABC transport system permease protein